MIIDQSQSILKSTVAVVGLLLYQLFYSICHIIGQVFFSRKKLYCELKIYLLALFRFKLSHLGKLFCEHLITLFGMSSSELSPGTRLDGF